MSDWPGVSYQDGEVKFMPGPIDVHAHPRVGDTLVDVSLDPLDKQDGKAGLAVYTETALASGIVAVHAMPNEFIRRSVIDNEKGLTTEVVPYPISNRDRTLFMERALSQESRIQASYYLGLDPNEVVAEDESDIDVNILRKNFAEAGERTLGLKIYGAQTTGGNNIPTRFIPEVSEEWFEQYPDKPIIMHLEDGDVRSVLEDMFENHRHGKEIPVHIAHVSSRQELEAVIWAKEQGMNVTCEVTPHHLFVSERARDLVGNYGCVKPSLKTDEDVWFLWENLEFIDIFASDCAPHKVSEKEGEKTVWGIANHTVMMPLLLGAVEEGHLTFDEIYQKMVVAPRERFNLGRSQDSISEFRLDVSPLTVAEIEADVNPGYGQNVFLKLEEIGQDFHLAGVIEYAQSGHSIVRREAGRLATYHMTSHDHLTV